MYAGDDFSIFGGHAVFERPVLDGIPAIRLGVVHLLGTVVGERLLEVAEMIFRHILHLAVEVEAEHTLREAPCVAIGAEAGAVAVVAGRGAVGHIATGLVEVIVEEELVGALLSSTNIGDGGVGIFAQLLFAEGSAPNTKFVDLATHLSRTGADGKLAHGGESGTGDVHSP